MTSFLMLAALFVLLVVALGLMRLLLGPANADRIMSAQLLGSGGITVLILLAVATETPSLLNVALLFALLAAFISVDVAFRLAQIVSQNPEAENVNFDWMEPTREVRIAINQDEARQLGLSSEALASVLNTVVSGSPITQVRDDI